MVRVGDSFSLGREALRLDRSLAKCRWLRWPGVRPPVPGRGWPGQRILKGGSITVPLTSCLTGLESAV
jgi:hypothetical protein